MKAVFGLALGDATRNRRTFSNDHTGFVAFERNNQFHGRPRSSLYAPTETTHTPPHVHVRPQYVEFVILSWADLGSVDPIFFLDGLPTHLEIGKRFFELA